MPLKGPSPTDDADFKPSRGASVTTPGVGKRYADPIRGKQSDDFFAIGGSGQDISAKLDRDARRR